MSITAFSNASSQTAGAAPVRASPAAKDAGHEQGGKTSGNDQLDQKEREQLSRLKARDAQVRQHEQAHLAASGGLATSGASYTYEKGPDGAKYAVGGEVHIDVAPGRTPQESIERARTVAAAALAPVDPSSADRAVAAHARQMEQQARAGLAQKVPDGEPNPQREKLNRLYSNSSPAGSLVDLFA